MRASICAFVCGMAWRGRTAQVTGACSYKSLVVRCVKYTALLRSVAVAAISPSTLAFDADCLYRCRLGTQGNQQPVDNSRKRRVLKSAQH
jgi:hypothetical protein